MRVDLCHICLDLIPSCPTRILTTCFYQKMLIKTLSISLRRHNMHYNRKCSLKEREKQTDQSCIESRPFCFNSTRQSKINILSNIGEHKFGSHSTKQVLCNANQVEFCTRFEHINPYIVMVQVLNSNNETFLRQNLFNRLNRSNKSLQHVFLTNYSSTSEFSKIFVPCKISNVHTSLFFIKYKTPFKI